MKSFTVAIVASLSVNAALLAALVLKPEVAPAAFRDFFAQRGNAAVVESAPPAASAVTRSTRDAGRPAAGRPKLWTTLTSGDLRTFAARLEAAGFPRGAIRTLVTAMVDETYGPRMREVTGADATLPFWKSPPMGMSARTADYLAISRERAQLLKELLGDYMLRDDGDITVPQRKRLGHLPREKIDAVEQINADYAEITAQVRAAMNNVTLPEDREKLALLEREKRADLAKILTPEELAEYDVRNSTTTARLRAQLTTMGATEAEFRAIYQVHQQFADALYPTESPANPADFARRRAEATQQVAALTKAALGEGRYAEYVRSSDRDYQQLKLITEREGLDSGTAAQAYALRSQVSAESNRILGDTALSDDGKRAALQALAQSTRSQFEATLGATGGPAYLNVADRWLTALGNGQAVTFTETGGMSFRAVGTPSREAAIQAALANQAARGRGAAGAAAGAGRSGRGGGGGGGRGGAPDIPAPTPSPTTPTRN